AFRSGPALRGAQQLINVVVAEDCCGAGRLKRAAGAVSRIVHGVSCAVERRGSSLVQNGEEAGQIVIAIVRRHAVWPRQTGATAKSVIRKSKRAGADCDRRRQSLQTIERVRDVRRRAAFGVRETRAVRRGVVGISRRENRRGKKAVTRAW